MMEVFTSFFTTCGMALLVLALLLKPNHLGAAASRVSAPPERVTWIWRCTRETADMAATGGDTSLLSAGRRWTDCAAYCTALHPPPAARRPAPAARRPPQPPQPLREAAARSSAS